MYFHYMFRYCPVKVAKREIDLILIYLCKRVPFGTNRTRASARFASRFLYVRVFAILYIQCMREHIPHLFYCSINFNLILNYSYRFEFVNLNELYKLLSFVYILWKDVAFFNIE